MTRLLCPLIATLALFAAGCGSDDDSASSSAPATDATTTAATTETTTTSSESSGSGGDTQVVKIEGFAFSPKATTVKVGQKIEFENEDAAGHNVVADSGADFESEILDQGGKFEFTPTKAGEITYECTLHPQMRGNTITVTS